jgi:predicted DNA-binding ribbon-helix-helix protein
MVNWKFWRKPKAQSYTMPNVNGTIPPAVQKFLADPVAFLEEKKLTRAERDATVAKILAAVQQYRGERDNLVAALVLIVGDLQADDEDLKSKIAGWLARLAQITGVAAIGALLLFGGQLYFAAQHPPQEVAGVNFPLSSVG